MMPAKTEDKIVDVSLKHIVITLGGLIIGGALAGTSVILIRDYVRFRRQKAFIESITQMIQLIAENRERK